MKESYWKRGSKEDAERIKQAFFDAGCQVVFFKCDKEDTLYVYDGEIHKMGEIPYNSVLANAIMDSHMFNELTLKVELKYKVGDWVVFNNNHNSIYQISEIRDSYYMLTHTHGGSMYLSFSQGKLIRPWTIEDAKDGDVLVCYSEVKGSHIEQAGIFKQYVGRHGGCSNTFLAHTGIDWDGNIIINGYMGSTNIFPATKEQRDILVRKMKEAGYEWDEKKKELRKIIKPKFKVGTMIRWANPQTREENWHMVIGIDNNKRVYRTKTWKSKDYEIPFEKERFYEVLPAPKPMFEYNDLVVLDDLLGRITESKYQDGMWLYRVGCRNTWNFDYELMKADHRDEHRILKGGGE